MGGDVPPAVTYWTGIWEPHREALSNQVQSLRNALAPESLVVSFSAGQRSSLHWKSRVVRLSASRNVVLRLLMPSLERLGDITHAFGSLDAWYFLRHLGRRPFIFTVALPGASLNQSVYERVDQFVAETPRLARELVGAGVPADRVAIIYPGVDLTRFSPANRPLVGPFRVLFASTPSDPREFEPRGIVLLIEVARRRPGVEFVFLWRTWGNTSKAMKAIQDLAPPSNVKIELGDISNMSAAYQSVHAVACCFAEDFGKSAPNSILEGLACGRPSLVTDTCGLADDIQAWAAGVVTKRTVDDVVLALDDLQTRHEALARQARPMAEGLFRLESAHEAYKRLYSRIADRRVTAKSFCRPIRREWP